MSAKGAVTWGELVGRLDHLEACCRRCKRRGRLRLARLIADHGAGTGLPDLAAPLQGGRPQDAAPDLAERCAVHFPTAARAALALSCLSQYSSVPTAGARLASPK